MELQKQKQSSQNRHTILTQNYRATTLFAFSILEFNYPLFDFSILQFFFFAWNKIFIFFN